MHDCSPGVGTTLEPDSDLISVTSGRSWRSGSTSSIRRSWLFGNRSSTDVRDNAPAKTPTTQTTQTPPKRAPSHKGWNRRSAIAGAINPSHWSDREYMKCITFSKTKDHLRWTPLHYAAKKGFVQAAARLLDDGIAIEARTMEDQTALHVATVEGQLGVVKLLLQRGANHRANDKQQRTPVALATEKNHFDIALTFFESDRNRAHFPEEKSQLLKAAIFNGDKPKLRRLLECNCDPNITVGGPRPLRVAVERGDAEIVNILLQNGSDPALRSADGSLPLATAVARNAAEIVRLLIKHGADPYAPSALGKSSFKIALERGDNAVMRVLMERNPGHVRTPSGEAYTKLSMLAVAIESNNIDAVRMLLEGGADQSGHEVDGSTPLIRAAGSDKIAILDLLLRHGADANEPDKNGISPIQNVILRTARLVEAIRAGNEELHQAVECEKKSIEVLQTLMQYGADLHTADANGKNSLHISAATGLKRTALFCLSNRFDINRADKAGWAALHWAAHGGNVSTAQVLKLRGASAEQPDRSGLTPLLIASKYCQNDVAFLLIGKSDVNHRDSNGRSALYYAAANENMLLVEKLLNNGAMAMEQDYNPTSPPSTPSSVSFTENGTTFFCSTRASEIRKLGATFELQQSHRLPSPSNLKRLLGFGAPPNTRIGGTPIACLAAMNSTDDAIKLLIAAKANINSSDRNGQTPLHIAASRGRFEIVQALVAAGADLFSHDTLRRTPEDVASKAGQDRISLILGEARESWIRASPVPIESATPVRMQKPSVRFVSQPVVAEAPENDKRSSPQAQSPMRAKTLSPKHRLSGWAQPHDSPPNRRLARSASRASAQASAVK